MKYKKGLTAVAFLVSVFLLASCGRSEESTVEKFYRSLEKGKISEAKGYVSVQVVGLLGDKKLSLALSKESENIRKCGGIKKVEVNLEGSGEIRSGTTKVTFNGDCEPSFQNTKLIKEDGEWKITAGK